MADIDVTTDTSQGDSTITFILYEDVGDDGSGSNSFTTPDGTVVQYNNSATKVLSGGVENFTLTGFDGGAGNAYYAEFSWAAESDVTHTADWVEDWSIDTGVSIPTAPSLAITNHSTNSITVEITDESTIEDEFRLYRSQSSPVTTSDTLIATEPTTDEGGTGSTIEVQDTGLNLDTTYHYAAVAYNSDEDGESALSNEVSQTTDAADDFITIGVKGSRRNELLIGVDSGE